jgi:hypothetical protein
MATVPVCHRLEGGSFRSRDGDDASDEPGRAQRPEVLKEAELERSEPGLSQILLRVHAAGANPTDWKHRAHTIWVKDSCYQRIRPGTTVPVLSTAKCVSPLVAR